MNTKTTRFSRAVIALVLGYLGVATVEWFVLGSTSLAGESKLIVFAALFALLTPLAYVSITALESYAIRLGLPVSKAIDVFYIFATIGIMLSTGATVAFLALMNIAPTHLVVPLSYTIGGVVAAAGGFLLYRDRIGNAVLG